MPIRQPQSLAEMQRHIEEALRLQEAGATVPFATISLEHGRAMGATRYLTIMPQDRGLEIGWTWLGPEVQRTGVNTEAKYLLLRHAFETLGAIRVQLKTHHNNLRSQRAIERLGAVREGTLRNHMIMPDGSYRHSVYFSVIDDEWPSVKTRLETLMGR
jgi:RimJ/RimL family protein N-acetyltransferase